MRSALICVFLALFVPRDGSCVNNEEDFRPTPIPLSDWPRDKQEPAGTLQEIIKTEAPPAVAAVPAHYWEDALRHSVYLTLVRDKIDQLIASGDFISPDSKPDNNVAKEIDDHDLWEKIKTARFDRLKEEPIPPGDATILAKGKLIEENNGYRFAEDNATSSNCSDDNCFKGVKAYWSVKRMRQGETSPGKYHYELTFSVTSHTRRKLKKPYENPVRTFTIKENSPTDHPEVRYRDQIYHHVDRPQRALWIHRNINPSYTYQKRPIYSRGLDRIFSSLFSDEDSYEEPSFRHKYKSYASQVYPQHQHAKVGYVEDREPYHQKKLMPYPMTKPQPYRYNHSPIPPPPVNYMQHPYLNVDPLGNIPYVPPYTDNRYVPSNVKTTRPAVLPTPITNYSLQKESTVEVPIKTKLNATEYTTKDPDVVTPHKMYNHHKQSPMKVNYFPDHIRPPVYNAPPGVFVTMDKKPFKPLPPLKFGHSNKPHKMMLPDFRPSPQVLDTQFSELDSSVDAAFRPITMNYTEVSNSQEGNDKERKNNKNNRKPSVAKKPTKKHENIKSHRLTTVSPEIITALSQSVEEDNAMEWANLLGAFTKTTPMASHRERSTTGSSDATTTTTPLSITFTEESFEDFDSTSEEMSPPASTTTTSTSTTTTTTTPKPKKRTRPPPKFTKQEKIKKHKRVTLTSTSTPATTSTTISTITTAKPTRKYSLKKPSDDLTPQASSAATSATNSIWETKTHKAPAATTASSSTIRPTTTIKLTTTSTSTTTSTPSTIVETEQPVATTQPKSKNRFRQSTLMQKGTSVNHDKWSTNTLDKNRTISVNNKFPLRRKASKFQGYVPISTPRSPEVERDKEDHRDHAYNSNKENVIETTTEQSDDILVKNPVATQPTYEEQEINNERPAEWHEDEMEDDDNNEPEHKGTENDVQESKDDKEYIFPTASTTHEVESYYISSEKRPITDQVTVPQSAVNKTKCKKKKHNNLTTTQETEKPSSETSTFANIITSSTTTTASSVTPDIFADLFGGFTMDDDTEKPKTESLTPPPEPNQSESEKHERYVHIDDDLEDFLHSLDQKSNHHPEEDKSEEEYDDEEDNDHEDSPFDNEEENSDSRNLNDDYYDETQENHDRPFSLLEFMAME